MTKHPLALVLALAIGTSAAWLGTMAQLPGSYVFPDHSTRTQFPGP